MGRVGYLSTTPAMSMQYSTIELTALRQILKLLLYNFFSTKKILVFLSKAYNKEKLIKNKVMLKSLKKDPLGISGVKLVNK